MSCSKGIPIPVNKNHEAGVRGEGVREGGARGRYKTRILIS